MKESHKDPGRGWFDTYLTGADQVVDSSMLPAGDLSSAQEERWLDHMVDTTGCSYDEARRRLGLSVDDPRRLAALLQKRYADHLGNKQPVQHNHPETIRVCGDCGLSLRPGQSCSHMRVGPQGGVYHSDDPRFMR